MSVWSLFFVFEHETFFCSRRTNSLGSSMGFLSLNLRAESFLFRPCLNSVKTTLLPVGKFLSLFGCSETLIGKEKKVLYFVFVFVFLELMGLYFLGNKFGAVP